MQSIRYYMDLLTEASYDGMVTSMKAKFPDSAAMIDSRVKWAKQLLKKSDRIVWFLRIVQASLNEDPTQFNQLMGNVSNKSLDALQTNLEHFFGYNIPAIERFQFQKQTVYDVLHTFASEQHVWKKKNEQNQPVTPQAGDQVVFKFANGTAWWLLNRAYCADEGRSGQHCGNVVGRYRKDQRILSYRSPKGHVLLTFILEPNGTLGEMKAKNNQKPAEQLHPYIMQLLLWSRIVGIAPTNGQYAPHMNFSVMDLDDANLKVIDQRKPNLIISQLRTNPVAILKAPTWIKDKYSAEVVKSNPSLGILLKDTSDAAWEKAVKNNEDLLIYAPPTLENFEDRVSAAIADAANKDYYDDEDDEGRIQRREPRYLLLQAPAAIQKNFNIVKGAIEYDSEVINQVSPNTKGYYELCTVAVDNNPNILGDLPDEVKDRNLYLTAVTSDGATLDNVPKEFCDQEMCFAALRSFAPAVIDFPPQLQTEEMYKLAVSKKAEALKYVPAKFVNRSMCLAAVTQGGIALRDTPEEFRDREICLTAMATAGYCLPLVPQELTDYEMCLTAVSNTGTIIEGVPRTLMDHKLCLAAVKSNGMALERIPGEFVNYEICSTAVATNGRALKDVPPDLIDYKISWAAVEEYGNALEFVPYALRDRKICLAAVKKNGRMLQFVPEELRDKEICLTAVTNDRTAYRQVPVELRSLVNDAFLNHISESLIRLKQLINY